MLLHSKITIFLTRGGTTKYKASSLAIQDCSEQLKGHSVENHISANKHCIIWINKDRITVTVILNDIII